MSSKAVSWKCVEIVCEESALRFLYILNLMKELNLIVIVLTVIGWYYQAFTARLKPQESQSSLRRRQALHLARVQI